MKNRCPSVLQRFPSLRWSLCATTASLLIGCAAAAADDKSSDAKAERANVIVKGLLQEREKFKSGVAVISGTVVRNLHSTRVKGPVAGLYAFETEGNKLRYDNAEPQYSWSINGKELRQRMDKNGGDVRKVIDEIEPKLFRMRLCYLRNPQYSAHWTLDGPAKCSHVQLMKPDQNLGRVPVIHHMYDVQAAGLFDYQGFENNKSLEECCSDLSLPIGDNLTEADDQAILGLGRTRLVVETRDGFRPVELTRTRETAQHTTKTRWRRQGKIDVPLEMSIIVDDPERKYHIEYHLKYDWKSVNEAVDPVYFDYHSFQDVPLNLYIRVFDCRGEKPLNLGDWAGQDVKPLPHHKKPISAVPDKTL